ncbi:unnamed protein product [Bursaphelenchus okinawaensis]|uniref:Uncharacterized protein n=1 Tax=Bursaphelenchus okinawaensis TaxID=465554 RepID=A0A811LAK9_9BILA|nr:unnamed protein product [Bursaphelenchus okinawaensis]CAG9120592.1 unnamed protein product [Bursaphelenchus okinawaensis]
MGKADKNASESSVDSDAAKPPTKKSKRKSSKPKSQKTTVKQKLEKVKNFFKRKKKGDEKQEKSEAKSEMKSLISESSVEQSEQNSGPMQQVQKQPTPPVTPTTSMKMKRGSCEFPSCSKKELKKDKQASKVTRSKKSSEVQSPSSEITKSAEKKESPSEEFKSRHFKNFINRMPTKYDGTDKQKAVRVIRKSKRKHSKNGEKDQKSGKEQKSEELKGSKELTEPKPPPPKRVEMALNKDDIDAMIRKLTPEQLDPDPNVYDPPDMTDEELDKRSENLFSLERCKINSAVTYCLMAEHEFTDAKPEPDAKNPKFADKIMRRTYNVVKLNRIRDDEFALVDLKSLPTKKEGSSDEKSDSSEKTT